MTPKGAPPPSLRSRLVVAFVALALGVLTVAGGATLAFARAHERASASDDLRSQADALLPLLNDLPVDRFRGLLSVLRLQEAAVIELGPRAGPGLPADLPAGLDLGDIDTGRVRAGEIVSGNAGSLVFVAAPIEVSRPLRARNPRADFVPPTRTLVLTRGVGGVDLGGLGPWLLAAGGLALISATIVGVVLARRLTRPLTATEEAARAIAAGDLSARVGDAGRADRELAQVADAFDDMATELERSRNVTRDFFMSVSHDLRTPLTSIRGYAEALAEGAVTKEGERKRAAGIIEAEARRLERLVSDLLDLARLDAGQFTLQPEALDVGAAVRATAEGFGPLATEYGVKITIDAVDGAERELDPDRLAQVVANLIENALKFAATTVQVGVTHTTRGGVDVAVSDDGPGIREPDLPRVFERLYTRHHGEQRAVGTGLGLAIVHELVTAMGGAVSAEPGGGGGTTMRVTLG